MLYSIQYFLSCVNEGPSRSQGMFHRVPASALVDAHDVLHPEAGYMPPGASDRTRPTILRSSRLTGSGFLLRCETQVILRCEMCCPDSSTGSKAAIAWVIFTVNRATSSRDGIRFTLVNNTFVRPNSKDLRVLRIYLTATCKLPKNPREPKSPSRRLAKEPLCFLKTVNITKVTNIKLHSMICNM